MNETKDFDRFADEITNLRDAIEAAEKARQWTDKMPLHSECRHLCKTADDYGVWPEHSCNATCEYLRNPPPTENHKQRGRMTAPTLIEAARAVVARWGSPVWSDAAHTRDELDALRAAIESAEKAEPVAYRVEIRWRNQALDQSWRKYADTAYRDRAIYLRDSAINMETESRIIPLFAGEPEASR